MQRSHKLVEKMKINLDQFQGDEPQRVHCAKTFYDKYLTSRCFNFFCKLKALQIAMTKLWQEEQTSEGCGCSPDEINTIRAL